LREAGEAFSALELPHTPEEAGRLLAKGAKRMVKRAREALKRARRQGDIEAFHDLRKVMKYHRMHLSLLGDFKAGATAARRRRADELGETLGELNDIDTLRAVLAAEEDAIDAPAAVEAVRRVLARHEKKLRKTGIREATALIDEGRRKFAARIEQKMRKAA
jgi:CHAD domain-containing protein